MKKVYACLTGNWVCLNDDPECVMGINRVKPSQWYEENAVIWSPIHREENDREKGKINTRSHGGYYLFGMEKVKALHR